MTSGNARNRFKLSPLWISLLFLFLVIATMAVWHFSRSTASFEGLDETEHHEGEMEHAFKDASEALKFLDELDRQLAGNRNDTSLLSQKIHVSLEYAPAKAAEECRRILEQAPHNYFALHHAAMAHVALTNFDRAMHYAARAIQVRDTVEARMVAGHIFYGKGDYTNALKHYRTAYKMDPTNEAAKGFIERTERSAQVNRK